MEARNFRPEHLQLMAHSPVQNYVLPGLTSKLIGNPSENGTVRLFECSRDHQEEITPHSHRFAFMCWVLEGEVRNRVWLELSHGERGDRFQLSTLTYGGDMGRYTMEEGKAGWWGYDDYHYQAGDCYSMLPHQIHSIHFARKTKVLFFEGPTISDTSVILEPVVDGKRIPTFKVEPWMFQHE